MLLAASAAVLVLALAFAVISSGHDVSNAIAMPVRHRALTARTALVMAAVLNVLGVALVALLVPMQQATENLETLLPDPRTGLLVVASALIVSIAWALLTWQRGLPASMGATLTSSLLAASLTAGALGLTSYPPSSAWPLGLLLLPVVLGPLVAFALSWVLLIPVVHLASRFEADQVTLSARVVLAIGATAINLGHGVIHGPRMIALVTAVAGLSGLSALEAPEAAVAMAVVVALCLAGGSLLGGWQIARTISSRMVRPDAVRGATAQAVAGALLLPVALGSDVQMSTSQTTAAAVLGAGVNQRFRSTHHVVVAQVIGCWIITIPACAAASAVLVTAASPLLSL